MQAHTPDLPHDFVELVRRAATILPDDMQQALAKGKANEELAALEKQIYEESNQLGIGPMGFGGKTTPLGVKIGVQHRLPASYFVSVAYMCWANRRASMDVAFNGDTVEVSYA